MFYRKIIYYSSVVLFSSVFMSGCWLLELNSKLAMNLMPGFEHNNEVLINEAQSLYIEKRDSFSASEWVNGPCLGMINDEWVVDVSHSPRLPLDDDLNNQCSEYYDGRAKHFIELSPDGILLNMK